jgi:hypothetical protein|tara:strand:+ start:14813 stop:15379 length:567 start_codon:yes stop_codon:yes gene_type:complete
MNFSNYLNLFDEIITAENPVAPYNEEAYFHYAELNHKRQDRWQKKGELSADTLDALSKINQNLNWVLITEPWCGDAAHSNPFIDKMADASDNIDLTVQLRDSGSEIDKYLTNGGKSIPILIVRDAEGNDIFRWGPRPEAAQEIHLKNLQSDKSEEEKKVELQKWYNADKGATIQKELVSLLKENKLIA